MSVAIATVNGWMAKMTKDGYAPKGVAKPFRPLKQAMKWAVAQDLVTKNPCDFCKPPKRIKTPINALNREDRTRMMRLARAAQPQPLGMAMLAAAKAQQAVAGDGIGIDAMGHPLDAIGECPDLVQFIHWI